MRELSRNPPEGQVWLTRPQARALGATAVSVAALMFFVGLMLGRKIAPEAEAAQGSQGSLIAQDVQEDALPELLARVERSAAREDMRQLTFPDELPADEPATLIPEETAADLDDPAIAAPGEPPQEAAPEGEGIPEEGWAVEVGAFSDLEAADGRVASLKESGLEAWRVESFEQGESRWRVRVGAWATKSEAAEALGDLRASLGQDNLVVATVR